MFCTEATGGCPECYQYDQRRIAMHIKFGSCKLCHDPWLLCDACRMHSSTDNVTS